MTVVTESPCHELQIQSIESVVPAAAGSIAAVGTVNVPLLASPDAARTYP